MNDFSTNRNADDYCAACEQGNIFYIGNPDGLSLPPIRGFVGALSTPTLPICEVETLLNTAADTPSHVQLDIGGRMCTLVPGPQHFGQCTIPEQLQVRIGVAPPPPPSPVAPAPFVPDPAAVARAAGIGAPQVPVGRYSSARLPGQYGTIAAGHETNALDVISEMNAMSAPPVASAPDEHPVLVIEVPTPPPGGDGPRDVDQLSDADTVWLSDAVKQLVKVIGNTAIRVAAILSVAEHRAFLREMGFRRARFYRMNGKPMVAFAGNNRLRTMVRGTTYGMAGLNGMKVSVLDSAFRTPAQNAQGGLTRLATRWGVIGIIFVTAVDVAAWYAQPANEREFTDLLVDLGLNLGTTVISAIAGTVIAGALIVGSGVAMPVVAFVALGLGIGIATGWVVSNVVNVTGLREGLKQALRNTSAVPDEIYQGMMTAP